jgi:tetratricopeptide (TPR) repeat protein
MDKRPLSVRLPNPPPFLVGRDRELAEVTAAIGRAPLTVVRGPDAVGRVALVLTALRRTYPEAFERGLYLRCRAGQSATELVIAALAPGHPPHADPDPTDLAIDLADAAETWILLDGLEDPSWAVALAAARWARRSHWIVVTSSPPTAELVPYTVGVSPLPAPALDELLLRWGVETSADRRNLLVVQAKGSPWRLRQLVTDPGRLGVSPASDSNSERVLRVLASLEVPVPTAALSVLGVDLPTLTTLVEQGLALGVAGQTELHPSARALFRGQMTNAELTALRDRLEESGDLGLIAEALRLHLAGGELDGAVRILERRGDELLAAGTAPRVARWLLPRSDARLLRWRLRAAVLLGDVSALLDLSASASLLTGPSDRILLAEALMRGNQVSAALTTLESCETAAALLVKARARATLGLFAAAQADLARLRLEPGRSTELDAAAEVLSVRVQALLNQPAAARVGLSRMPALLPTLPTPARIHVTLAMASIHHDLGDLDGVDATLAEVDRLLVGDPLAVFVGRRAGLVRAITSIERGQLDQATTMLEELERASAFGSLHRPFLALIRAQLALARGDLALAVSVLGRVDPDVRAEPYAGAWFAALTTRIGLLAPGLITPASSPSGPGMWPLVARLHAARLSLRSGQLDDEAARAAMSTGDDAAIELWFAARAYSWELALLAGQPEDALRIATNAAERLAAAGFRLLEAEAHEGVASAALRTGEQIPLATALRRLSELAVLSGAARWERTAAGLRSWLQPDPGLLLKIASNPCPDAPARRARALLGDERALDALDQVVLGGLPRLEVRTLFDRPHWQPGWCVALHERRVYPGDGSTSAMADKPRLWTLLERLIASPAGLTREALFSQGWGLPFRPARHGKLLQNTVLKLRKAIESGPAAPPRILTTDAGYRLSDAEPIRVITTSDR